PLRGGAAPPPEPLPPRGRAPPPLRARRLRPAGGPSPALPASCALRTRPCAEGRRWRARSGGLPPAPPSCPARAPAPRAPPRATSRPRPAPRARPARAPPARAGVRAPRAAQGRGARTLLARHPLGRGCGHLDLGQLEGLALLARGTRGRSLAPHQRAR